VQLIAELRQQITIVNDRLRESRQLRHRQRQVLHSYELRRSLQSQHGHHNKTIEIKRSLNDHDTSDLDDFFLALRARYTAETNQITQLEEYIRNTKVSLLQQKQDKELVRRELLVSRKQVVVGRQKYDLIK